MWHRSEFHFLAVTTATKHSTTNWFSTQSSTGSRGLMPGLLFRWLAQLVINKSSDIPEELRRHYWLFVMCAYSKQLPFTWSLEEHKGDYAKTGLTVRATREHSHRQSPKNVTSQASKFSNVKRNLDSRLENKKMQANIKNIAVTG